MGGAQAITLDIRSVNSRFLDVIFKLPDEQRHLEPKLRDLVTKAVRRGKCEIKLSYQRSPVAIDERLPSPERIEQLMVVQEHIHHYAPQAQALSVAEIIASLTERGSINESVVIDIALLELMQTTLGSFLEARALEGAKLADIMRMQIHALEQLRQQLIPLIPNLIEQQQQKFLQRFNQAVALSDGQLSLATATERALAEATAFAIRADVTEEIDRLGSHLTAIAALLTRPVAQGKQELGKRLEFLIQELHREANTLGSKSASIEVTRIALEMKVLIEQLREQVQNVE